MSNEVYGYFDVSQIANRDAFFAQLQEKTGIGIKSINFSELYGFPKYLLPTNMSRYAAFIIGDKPGKTNTTYLTDYLDYAPGADIGFPVSGKVRLRLLIGLLVSMILESHSRRLVVAITDSSQIEQVKDINFEDLGTTIETDFEEFAPPDCIYNVASDCK
jgi:hypothetical protein